MLPLHLARSPLTPKPARAVDTFHRHNRHKLPSQHLRQLPPPPPTSPLSFGTRSAVDVPTRREQASYGTSVSAYPLTLRVPRTPAIPQLNSAQSLRHKELRHQVPSLLNLRSKPLGQPPLVSPSSSVLLLQQLHSPSHRQRAATLPLLRSSSAPSLTSSPSKPSSTPFEPRLPTYPTLRRSGSTSLN